MINSEHKQKVRNVIMRQHLKVLEKMKVCDAMPFTKISNSANQFLQTSYGAATAGCGIEDHYIKYHEWYYDKACDVLENPEKYSEMNCTEIVTSFNTEIRKKAVALYKENDAWYGAIAAGS